MSHLSLLHHPSHHCLSCLLGLISGGGAAWRTGFYLMGGKTEQLPAGPAGDSSGLRGLGDSAHNRMPWGEGDQAEVGTQLTAAPSRCSKVSMPQVPVPKPSCLSPAPGLESCPKGRCIHTVLTGADVPHALLRVQPADARSKYFHQALH